MAEADQHKTAVITPFGLFEYKVMPMGLKNATQTLQRYVDSVLAGISGVIVYCDDILLFSDSSSHLELIDQVLHLLHTSGLVANKQKSEFYKDTVEFLGHTLTSGKILPSRKHLQAILDFEVPKTVRQLRRFLGMINFYRKFMPGLSSVTQPLTALTSSKVTFQWTETAQQSFDRLLSMLQHTTDLCYLAPDDVYTLTTDASATGIGAALHSNRGPVGFFSSTLHGPETNYSAYDKELLGVFKAVRHFEWLLLGKTFTLRTDHKPLIYMFNKVATNERRRRQIQYLSTFDARLEHIAGSENTVADTLSRATDVNPISFTTSLLELSA